MNIDHPSSWDALPDKIRRVNQKTCSGCKHYDELKKKGRKGVGAVALEYTQVTSRVFKVRTVVFEYVPRISGTRHGLRCIRVRIIV